MTQTTTAQKKLTQQLYEIGAIKFGSFRIKLHDKHPDAPLSPIYLDMRVLRRFPEAKNTAIDVYEELVRPLTFDLLADIPTAGTPLTSSLSDRLGIGMITPRADVKTHGSGAKVDGMLESDKGKTAVLIDDLVTMADSKLEAAETLTAQGIKVTDVVVLIDREQGGQAQLAKVGLQLHAGLTMDKMLQVYVQTNKISQSNYQDIMQKIVALNTFVGV